MFCSKCGKKIVEGDVFCPSCGTRIEWDRFSESRRDEPSFAPDIIEKNESPAKKETFDFNWDLEAFNHKRKTEEVNIEWGDLLGIEERREAVASRIESVEETGKPAKKKAEFTLEPYIVNPPKAEKPVARPEQPDLFKTFNQKNEDFQKLVEREKERIEEEPSVPVAEPEPVVVEEPVIEDILEEIPEVEEIPVVDEIPENEEIAAEEYKASKKSFFGFFKRRNEQEIEEPVLTADNDDIEGGWTEEIPQIEVEEEIPEELEPIAETVEEPVIEEPEVIPEPIVEEAVTVEEIAKDAATENEISNTQKISREEFADFLRRAEEQFGIENELEEEESSEQEPEEPEIIPEEVEEPIVEPEPEEQPAPIVQPIEETAPEVQPVESVDDIVDDIVEKVESEDEPSKSRRKAREKTGEFHLGDFKDDNFWEDDSVYNKEEEEEEEYRGKKKKGSKAGTMIIIILALILFAQLGILLVRFQFPDSQIAHFIEPRLTVIENWIRGLF